MFKMFPPYPFDIGPVKDLEAFASQNKICPVPGSFGFESGTPESEVARREERLDDWVERWCTRAQVAISRGLARIHSTAMLP